MKNGKDEDIPPMNFPQQQAFEETMREIADLCSSVPQIAVKQYDREARPIIAGSRDAEMMVSATLEEIKVKKTNIRFYRDLGTHVLQIRETIKKYMIATGQLQEKQNETARPDNDNGGVPNKS